MSSMADVHEVLEATADKSESRVSSRPTALTEHYVGLQYVGYIMWWV